MSISTLLFSPLSCDITGTPTYGKVSGSPSLETFIGATKGWKWGVGDAMHIEFQPPHGWDQTSFSPHTHFTIGASGAGSKVKWSLSYVMQDSNLLWPADDTDATPVETSVATTTTHKGYVATFAIVTPANYALEMIIRATLTRIAASSDEFEGDVFLDYFDLHFPVVALGRNT